MFWIITITMYTIYIRTVVRQAPMFGATVAISLEITNSGSSTKTSVDVDVVLRQAQNIQVIPTW